MAAHELVAHADSPVLLATCAAGACGLCLAVPAEQALLAMSMPAGCVWALLERERAHLSWAARTIYVLAAAASAHFLVPWGGYQAAGPAALLPVLALWSLALTATRLLRYIPGSEFLPWGALLALNAGLFLGGPEVHAATGFKLGRTDGWPLLLALLCIVLSTTALVGWSLWWAEGAHGPIQEALGPRLSPLLVVVFAAVNAVGEEVEFRMLFFGGLLVPPAGHLAPWLALAVGLQAAFFATLHVASGFPSGASGGALVFLWAIFLGILRLWTGGMGLVLLLHFQADIAVFGLVYLQERRTRRPVPSSEDGSRSCSEEADRPECAEGAE